MDRGRKVDVDPKIWGVLNFVKAHEGACRADLVRLGTSLDLVGQPGGLSYQDFHAWLVYSINSDASTAVYLSQWKHSWDQKMVIAVRTMEALEGGNWQRAGRSSAPKPKPFPRPEALKKKGDTAGEKQWGKPAPLSEIQKFLERKNGKR